MDDFEQLVPEHIRMLAGYSAGKSLGQAERESGVSCIKLASNENPFGPSPRAVAAMKAAVTESNFYPDNDATELRDTLAAKNTVKPEHVLVGAGSSDLLGITCRTLLKPGLNAVTSRLSFIVYPIATRAAGGELIEVRMQNNAFDLEAIARAINSDTRIVFLANPNNPTGTLFNARALDSFLSKVPRTVTVIVDEAYYDFAQFFAVSRGVEYSHSLDYVREGRNVIVLRTFSKAHGLAGIRVGYGFGPPELMACLGRMRTTFSVSVVAQAGALAALEDEAHVQKAIENNAEGAAFLFDNLSRMGCHVTPTWANFVYCELNDDATTIAKRLQDEGVIIRPLGAWGNPNAIRVTVGTPEQNERFVSAFAKVVVRSQ
jgi:histidinol-phosphate aminotransferase